VIKLTKKENLCTKRKPAPLGEQINKAKKNSLALPLPVLALFFLQGVFPNSTSNLYYCLRSVVEDSSVSFLPNIPKYVDYHSIEMPFFLFGHHACGLVPPCANVSWSGCAVYQSAPMTKLESNLP